jgi:polyhydroxyalkanoate synthesis regulator phasin
MPLGVLREIIRHGGEAVAGFYQEKVQNRLSQSIEDVRTRTESLRENIEQRVRGVTQLLRREGTEGEKNPVKDVLAAGQSAVEELRSKVDQSVKQALDAIGTPSSINAEIEKLRAKLDALEQKIDQIGK